MVIVLRILLVLLVVAFAGEAKAQPDEDRGLFTEIESDLPPEAENAVATFLCDEVPPELETIRECRFVRVAFEQLRAASEAATTVDGVAPSSIVAATLALNLFDGVLLSAIVERATQTASGAGYALSGRIDEGDERGSLGAMTLVVYDEDGGSGEAVTGTIKASIGTFTITPIGAGVHAIRELDASALPPLGEPLEPPTAREVPDDPSPPSMSEIDVAIFYTPAARAGASMLVGITGITALVDLMFENANAAYETSGARQRITLVLLRQVDYTEAERARIDLHRLTDPSDGIMDEVHQARNEYDADLVHLISAPKDVCGLAWGGPDEQRGFGLTGYHCEVNDYSFAHELGHNMGLNHDRYAVKCAGQAAPRRPANCQENIPNRPYAHSYGYVNQQAFSPNAPMSKAWMTIMAYDWQCFDAGIPRPLGARRFCQRARSFSNPGLSYLGDAVGVSGDAESQDVTGPADAVRTLNLTRTQVANFR